ncbi:putative holin-like toxin [Leuconostoc gelidum subsp. gelidum]|uniref:Holin-like toxin n=1 Tax=Leuconostoc gelidum subsp. gelidum TaxID=1607839 RepID=A0AB35FYZ6_LEUGE|nr:putative holin-like toxin [Leuconostoc gelidum subsp. gelidum]MBZ5974446.1 putative holin-like toxin [Leuconostoc gelidum subsp. gelidum]MBZ5977285.1 putative holin-like toxin [Leuconostoc gelidum subsp. gelidum]MBZ5998937.1 putative holin-like toxin [Leuconostoc gelidum subsp. gelidum]MBZ6015852.1 putative holin-like toxin [Leuconostoc gelidum subsp. gelidum]
MSIESAIGLMFSFGMFIIALLSLVVLIINSTKK